MKPNNSNTKDVVFIYDLKQAYFYIQQGLLPLRVGFNEKSESYYMLFDKDLSNPLYTIWLRREARVKDISKA